MGKSTFRIGTMTQDKLSHAFAGMAIAALLYPFGLMASLVAVIVAALAKELVWDGWLRRGTAEVTDVVATIAGGAFYFSWMWIIA